ncbi:hypothetical protein QU40_00240, partial [Staphylococcus aureus]
HQRNLAEARQDPRQSAVGLPHRDGRRDRGIGQGQRVDLRALPPDGDRDADAADDPAAELLAPRAGVPDGAARHRRRGARPAGGEPAVRLRGAAGPDRAGGYDHAKHGDSGRSDRERRGPWHDPQGSHRGSDRPARPACGVDG